MRVIFAVKLIDTESAARGMAPLVGERTRVLTLQNGIDSVAMIRKQLDSTATVLGDVMCVSAVIERPGVIRSPDGMHVVVADRTGCEAIMAAFADAATGLPGLDVKLADDAAQAVWE